MSAINAPGPSPRARLKHAVEARAVELGRTEKSIYTAAGVTYETWRRWKGGVGTTRALVDKRISHQLGWPPGAREAMLNGGSPPRPTSPLRHTYNGESHDHVEARWAALKSEVDDLDDESKHRAVISIAGLLSAMQEWDTWSEE